jgi:hypothetical protein
VRLLAYTRPECGAALSQCITGAHCTAARLHPCCACVDVCACVYLHRRAIGRLQFTDQFGQGFHCTGSMIDSTSILTAGHCVHGGKYGSWFTNFKWTPGQDGSRKPYGTVSAGTRPTW